MKKIIPIFFISFSDNINVRMFVRRKKCQILSQA